MSNTGLRTRLSNANKPALSQVVVSPESYLDSYIEAKLIPVQYNAIFACHDTSGNKGGMASLNILQIANGEKIIVNVSSYYNGLYPYKLYSFVFPVAEFPQVNLSKIAISSVKCRISDIYDTDKLSVKLWINDEFVGEKIMTISNPEDFVCFGNYRAIAGDAVFYDATIHTLEAKYDFEDLYSATVVDRVKGNDLVCTLHTPTELASGGGAYVDENLNNL